MFKLGFDDISAQSPQWYTEVDRQLERASYDEAARIAKDSVKKCSESGDKSGEVQAMCAYTKALLAMDDVWNARRYGEQARELAEHLQEKSLEGSATHVLAKALLKDPEERRIASTLDNRAVTYSEMCARLADKGMSDAEHMERWTCMPSAAVTFADRASKLFADAGNELGEASVMITSARIALKGKQLRDAQRFAEAAAESFQKLGDVQGEAAARYVDYEIKLNDDLIDEAVVVLDSIVQCYKQLDNSSSAVGSALLLAAELLRLQGDLHGAVDRAAQSAQDFHDAFDANHKAEAVLSMAKSFLGAEQFDDATEAGTACVELFKGARNKKGQAQSLSILAECCAKSGKHPEAVYRLEEAAFLCRQSKDKKNEAHTLNLLSKLQLKMLESGAEVEATNPSRHARRAVQLFEDSGLGETQEMAEASLTVAKGLHKERELEEAVGHAARARDLFEKVGDKVGESGACAVLAQIHFEDKDNDQGLKMSQKCLELAQETGDQSLQALATNLLTNQGKKKEESKVVHTDIDILFYKVRIAQFTEFETRRARYKAVEGNKRDDAIKDKQPAQLSLGGPKDVQKVEYVIRWQRVSHLNLAAMPKQPPPVPRT